ncbi:Hypothetical protein CINCED_3A010708 [Cinara cedri]|uniref:Uncharacterized protein n=1 Tax=Cinara cedri TaxID=506608 RepID=A0A5E4MQL3_9HEMI|nr:Hypothetical protein CINCED_3A010708 [Cinara cedri]
MRNKILSEENNCEDFLIFSTSLAKDVKENKSGIIVIRLSHQKKYLIESKESRIIPRWALRYSMYVKEKQSISVDVRKSVLNDISQLFKFAKKYEVSHKNNLNPHYDMKYDMERTTASKMNKATKFKSFDGSLVQSIYVPRGFRGIDAKTRGLELEPRH